MDMKGRSIKLQEDGCEGNEEETEEKDEEEKVNDSLMYLHF